MSTKKEWVSPELVSEIGVEETEGGAFPTSWEDPYANS